MESLGRIEVQKKLMSDLHARATPFQSRREKILYCESFYKSLGCEYGRNTGRRIPIQISSACRHFFHNNLQIGDVPKWARSEPDLLIQFIEVLRIYGPTQAKMKAKKATLENPRRLEIIPLDKRENFVHLLDGYDMTPEDELELKRRRSRAHLQAPAPTVTQQENKCTQFNQMLAAVLTSNLLMVNPPPLNPLQILVQNALKLAAENNTLTPGAVPNDCPALSAALSVTESTTLTEEPSSPDDDDKENSSPRSKKRCGSMIEDILDRIKKTKSWKENNELEA